MTEETKPELTQTIPLAWYSSSFVNTCLNSIITNHFRENWFPYCGNQLFPQIDELKLLFRRGLSYGPPIEFHLFLFPDQNSMRAHSLWTSSYAFIVKQRKSWPIHGFIALRLVFINTLIAPYRHVLRRIGWLIFQNALSCYCIVAFWAPIWRAFTRSLGWKIRKIRKGLGSRSRTMVSSTL